MLIEHSRNRLRTSGPVSPRPDGISRRVATAARDRRLGPLPEQRPTGWHRLVFDNPPRPVASDSPARHPAPEAADRRNPARPAPPDPIRSTEPRSAEDATRSVAPGPEAGGPHRRAGSARRQLGRVLDQRPERGRRWAAAVLATVGAVATAGVLLLGVADPAPADPAPGPASPSAVGSVPPSTASAEPTPAGARPPVPTPVDPAGPASAAVVSTLAPGDPGFGWPSTAFGTAPTGG